MPIVLKGKSQGYVLSPRGAWKEGAGKMVLQLLLQGMKPTFEGHGEVTANTGGYGFSLL